MQRNRAYGNLAFMKVLVSLAAVAVLAGCGGGAGTADAPALPIAPAPSLAPTPTPAPVSFGIVAPASIESGINVAYNANDYFSTPIATPKNKLFVFLPGTGGVPSAIQGILREGARRGYHVIGLTYDNGTEVNQYCASSTDASCWGNVRNEIIYGQDTSPLVTVSAADSVVGRLNALLSYLTTTYPNQGWDRYFSAGSPVWSTIVVGGHSQGAGDAAYLAKGESLAGVCTFDSPDDGNARAGAASWLSTPSTTSVTLQYGFTNMDDSVAGYNGVTGNWSLLGFPGIPFDVDGSQAPYGNSHQLYTVVSSSVTPDTHGYTVVDSATPLQNGVPVYAPVWDQICFP